VTNDASVRQRLEELALNFAERVGGGDDFDIAQILLRLGRTTEAGLRTEPVQRRLFARSMAFVSNAKFLADGTFIRSGRDILPVREIGSVQKVLEYEERAAECRRKAAQMASPSLKKQMEDMAGVWDRLARERRHGVVENSPDKSAASDPSIIM
jgi:hypothetical protein